jgi:hypothetical protein
MKIYSRICGVLILIAFIIGFAPLAEAQTSGVQCDPNKSELKVNTHPSDLKAKWKLKDGSTWYNDEYTLKDLQPGQYVVEFEDLDDYDKPEDKIVSLTAGVKTELHGTYIGTKGSLKVDTHPSDLGAGWRLQGMTAWYADCYTLTGMDPGTYTIEFEPRVGYKEPDPKQVVVEIGKTTKVDAQYLEGDGTTGSLKVDTQPTGHSGGWRFPGMNTWWPDGHTEKGLAPGSYTVEFEPKDGWTHPAPLVAKVELGKTTVIKAQYLEGDGTTGSLKVDTHPTGRSGGWRIQGMNSWFPDCHTEKELQPGQYVVEFQPMAGLLHPSPRTVTVEIGKTTKVDGYYIEGNADKAHIMVDTHHSGLKAKWRLTSDGIWRNDEDIVNNLTPGTYTVEFEVISGYQTPPAKTVNLPAGVVTEVHYTYVKGGDDDTKGYVRVDIDPSGAREAGAAWSMTYDGKTEWRNSGQYIYNVEPGTYTISFNNIKGWTAPNAVELTVTAGKKAYHTAVYTEEQEEPMIRSFYADHRTIVAGDATKIHWFVEDATSVEIDGIGVDLGKTGVVDVSPATSTTYTITATGPGGSVTASIVVDVVESAKILSLSNESSPNSPVSANTNTLIQASVNGSREVKLIEKSTGKEVKEWQGDGPLEASVSPRKTTKYQLIAESAGNTDKKEITVYVTPKPVIKAFAVNKPFVNIPNTFVTFSWDVSGAKTIEIEYNGEVISKLAKDAAEKPVNISGIGTYTLVAKMPTALFARI